MQFRRMTLDDLDQVAAFSMAGLRAHLYPLWPSQEKVRHVVRHFIESETDFHLAAFDGERMVGGIAAAVTEMLWFERCEATVVMFRAQTAGVGAGLLDDMKTWAARDMRIRRVQIACEFDAPKAMARYLAMRGFKHQQVMAVAYKE